ncbi:MAG: hypothetical protein JNK21_08800 [Rhodospirillaceae bacterium]|nr:hypothetical protein [Rhodospirillaceae bacterium]
MTTIATDGKVMAADSRLTGDYIDQFNSTKLYAVNGEIVGTCGTASEGLAYIQWLQDSKAAPKLSDKFEALHLTRGGIFSVDRNLVRIRVAKVSAIGSGCGYAMGAMLAGASPGKAVQIAAKLDPHTGGKIVTMKLSGR